MESQKIKAIVIMMAALCFAIYLGVAVATNQLEAVAWVAGALAVVFVLALGKNVWLLIVAGVSLGGGISAIPGSPKVWWVGMAVTTAIFVMRFALRRTGDFSFKWNLLDFAILLQLVAVGQAFMRNPVGLSMLGGDQVGGKPYFLFAFAAVCYVLLASVRADLRTIRLAVIVMIGCSIFDAGLALLSAFVPAVAMAILPIYSGVSFASAQATQGADAATNRVSEGKEVGESLALAAFTLYRPFSTLNPMNLFRFSLMLLAVGSMLISGYRSGFAAIAILFIVGSLVRRRVADVLIAMACGVLLLSVALFVGVDNLPHGAKRILSVLPLPGLEGIRESAQDSSNWRFEMWEEALTSDRYIENKLLGDGFGFRADELAAVQDMMSGDRRRAQGMSVQEIMLVRGSFHGFHVETIRMTGVVGLLMALIGMGIFFRYAMDHIRYFRGRDEWGYVLYLCVPFLIYPFYAMLVFGTYKAFPIQLVLAGMLKMLCNVRREEARVLAAERDSASRPSRAEKLDGRSVPQRAPA